jgi:hypothetical protein
MWFNFVLRSEKFLVYNNSGQNLQAMKFYIRTDL